MISFMVGVLIGIAIGYFTAAMMWAADQDDHQ